MTTYAVIGGSGFVGSAVVRLLSQEGHDVTAVAAPRISSAVSSPQALAEHAVVLARRTSTDLSGFDVIINAAGLAAADSSQQDSLFGANAVLPAALQQIARSSRARRFVHISSSAVQGRSATLTEEAVYAPDSDYSRSKVGGERALAVHPWTETVILRPTSVHGQWRSVTRRLAALARSRFSSVGAPGHQHTPQVHVDSVARAVLVLATTGATPPPIVLQPSEGFTSAEFLAVLGRGRRPRIVPSVIARRAVDVGYAAARVGGSPIWAQARRAEMLLFGQEQVPGWLAPRRDDIVVDRSRWQDLAEALATADVAD